MRAVPSRYASRIAPLSIVDGPTAATAAEAASRNASPSAPSGTSARPGFVQNCPLPSVNDATQPCAIAGARSAAAAGVTASGLSEPSSP